MKLIRRGIDVLIHNSVIIKKEATKFCEENNVFKISLNCKDDLENFYSLSGFEKRQ